MKTPLKANDSSSRKVTSFPCKVHFSPIILCEYDTFEVITAENVDSVDMTYPEETNFVTDLRNGKVKPMESLIKSKTTTVKYYLKLVDKTRKGIKALIGELLNLKTGSNFQKIHIKSKFDGKVSDKIITIDELSIRSQLNMRILQNMFQKYALFISIGYNYGEESEEFIKKYYDDLQVINVKNAEKALEQKEKPEAPEVKTIPSKAPSVEEKSEDSKTNDPPPEVKTVPEAPPRVETIPENVIPQASDSKCKVQLKLDDCTKAPEMKNVPGQTSKVQLNIEGGATMEDLFEMDIIPEAIMPKAEPKPKTDKKKTSKIKNDSDKTKKNIIEVKGVRSKTNDPRDAHKARHKKKDDKSKAKDSEEKGSIPQVDKKPKAPVVILEYDDGSDPKSMAIPELKSQIRLKNKYEAIKKDSVRSNFGSSHRNNDSESGQNKSPMTHDLSKFYREDDDDDYIKMEGNNKKILPSKRVKILLKKDEENELIVRVRKNPKSVASKGSNRSTKWNVDSEVTGNTKKSGGRRKSLSSHDNEVLDYYTDQKRQIEERPAKSKVYPNASSVALTTSSRTYAITSTLRNDKKKNLKSGPQLHQQKSQDSKEKGISEKKHLSRGFSSENSTAWSSESSSDEETQEYEEIEDNESQKEKLQMDKEKKNNDILNQDAGQVNVIKGVPDQILSNAVGVPINKENQVAKNPPTQRAMQPQRPGFPPLTLKNDPKWKISPDKKLKQQPFLKMEWTFEEDNQLISSGPGSFFVYSDLEKVCNLRVCSHDQRVITINIERGQNNSILLENGKSLFPTIGLLILHYLLNPLPIR